MKKSLLYSAVKLARNKLNNHPEYYNFPHYSFIVVNNSILDWATNSSEEPPIHYGYHRKNDKSYRPKFHSEIRVYKKAKGLLNDCSFELINIRLNKFGVLLLSQPCSCCYELLTELGCSRFYFSSRCGFMTII